MSKRKREFKSTEAGSGTAAPPLPGETDLPGREAAPREKAPRPAAPPSRQPHPSGAAGSTLSTELKENILLGVLILYVLLLAVGTAGELFELDWILGLPLFK